MILTASMITHMRRYWKIDDSLSRMLLEQLGTEPYPHEYTEQDIHEQSRTMIIQYNRDHTRTAINRLQPHVAEESNATNTSGGDILKTDT